jgi:1,4-alpha-glucan branching enzyme
MSLKKQFLKSKDVCKVTFRIGKNECPGSDQAFLVGDFNHWDRTSHEMKKLKSGEFTATLELEPGRAYQFRYLLDGERWQNDWEADGYSPSAFPPEENSVVRV